MVVGSDYRTAFHFSSSATDIISLYKTGYENPNNPDAVSVSFWVNIYGADPDNHLQSVLTLGSTIYNNAGIWIQYNSSSGGSPYNQGHYTIRLGNGTDKDTAFYYFPSSRKKWDHFTLTV